MRAFKRWYTRMLHIYRFRFDSVYRELYLDISTELGRRFAEYEDNVMLYGTKWFDNITQGFEEYAKAVSKVGIKLEQRYIDQLNELNKQNNDNT